MPLDQTSSSVFDTEAAVRVKAARLFSGYGARVTCAARRWAGEVGAGLTEGPRDMIRDRTIIAEGGPVAELVNLLARGEPAKDLQAIKVRGKLTELRDDIEDLGRLRLDLEFGSETEG